MSYYRRLKLTCTECGESWFTQIFEDCPRCGSIETQVDSELILEKIEGQSPCNSKAR